MRDAAAWHLMDGEPVLVDFHVEANGRVRLQDSRASSADRWLLRLPLNAHTHIGDAFLTGQVPNAPLAALVAPPDGFKHRALAAASAEQIEQGMRKALAEYEAAGMRRILDFREGGRAGVDTLLRVLAEGPVAPVVSILGRTVGAKDDGVSVLEAADGLGIVSVSTPDQPDLVELAARAQEMGRYVALHASEDRREPIDEILGLAPDLLVHMCHATRSDLEDVADDDVPVAVCPSSNARFGLKPPIELLEDLEATWWIGTDNAMFGARSVLAEAALLHDEFPDISPLRLVEALEAADFEERWDLREPDPRFLLLPVRAQAPNFAATPTLVGLRAPKPANTRSRMTPSS
jgi:cytosine/adenosine deaminase-related metal-dependent hydrolase